MSNPKLDLLASKLLDIGKGNNLVSFKDTKSGTVEVLYPDFPDLLAKVESSVKFEIYNPDSEDDEVEELLSDNDSDESKNDTQSMSRSEFYEKYTKKIHKKSQMLVYNTRSKPIQAIKSIHKKTTSILEETGVNVAYMAFGFLQWKESENSELFLRAPILLSPIAFENESVVEPYYVRMTEEDVLVNPTFLFKIKTEYGLSIQDINQFKAENDEDGSVLYLHYLDYIESVVAPLKWTVTRECKIGTFSFQKISMYQDLKNNQSIILKNDNVRAILGLDVANGSSSSNGMSVPAKILDEVHNIVDADSSQLDAIEMAKSGKSFVLQGPPGTGKSQTITNLIAECLNDDKKVLFVSEKMAALNVVYDKLKQADLEEFCLELHSHKANKKDVITNLCETLKKPRSIVSGRAATEIDIKKKSQQQLDDYAVSLHKQRDVIGLSLYQLYEQYYSVSGETCRSVSIDFHKDGAMYLSDAEALLEQYQEYIPSVGYDYRLNPWYGFMGRDMSYERMQSLNKDLTIISEGLAKLATIQKEFLDKYGITIENWKDTYARRDQLNYVGHLEFLRPSVLSCQKITELENAIGKMAASSDTILSARHKIDSSYDQEVYGLDGKQLKDTLISRFSNGFSRLFNKDYHDLVSQLRIKRKDGKRVSYREAVDLFDRLISINENNSIFSEKADIAIPYFSDKYNGIETDWKKVTQEMAFTVAVTALNPKLGRIPNMSAEEHALAKDDFTRYAQLIGEVIQKTDESIKYVSGLFDKETYNWETADLQNCARKAEACVQNPDRITNWFGFFGLLNQLKEKKLEPFIVDAISMHTMENGFVPLFKKSFYKAWIDHVIASEPALSGFTRISQDQAVRRFSEKDKNHFEICKAEIRAHLSAKRPKLDLVVPNSAVSILLREGEKKRRLKTIRALLSEAGEVIQTLKPCFLMSPLSISTFLSDSSVHFDVVIFDEASQIFPQDAIGAIYRGKQLIVVGDSKQMPPSNFFNASGDVDEEEAGDVGDFESILDVCSASMPQLRLKWHYRSKFEQLIAFSNKNFYDNELVTFPSSHQQTDGFGVSFVPVNGIFDHKSKTNMEEAKTVVDLIYEHIDKYPNRSLGVVAFSVSQQSLIDNLLSRTRRSRPEKEPFFNGDKKEPFFIKNLETVQGDERDTIIFSVAYGKDSVGKVSHNFGPLNRMGGERRLNVAVTRAKFNVILVSSMHYTDIDLKRTQSRGAALLKEYLDYAENGEIALKRSLSVPQNDTYDSDFEMDVCSFLKEKGFEVDTQIGCSGFRIDLGLKRPGTSDYALAIECDGASYHSSKNARDRDRLRQEILEGMGWNFYRIWSTDWYRNGSVERENLLKAARKALKQTSEEEAAPSQPQDERNPYEFSALEEKSLFPEYKCANIKAIARKYPDDSRRTYLKIVKEVLEIEAPLAEEWLLRRSSFFFDRERVTKVVRDEYETIMSRCRIEGIQRKNGFLYLDPSHNPQLRLPGNSGREIKYIAPEELANGMYTIIKENVEVDKEGLFRLTANQLGVTRLGPDIMECFENAFHILIKKVNCSNDRYSIKE